MSQNPFPYSAPDQSMAPPPKSGTNVLLVVAIVCGTMLLVCGGVIAFGVYAMNRLAEEIAQLEGDFGSWDEEEAAHALEYGLADNPSIRERVGEIQQVEMDDGLTFDDKAGEEDWFYRVKGSTGEAIVVVQFEDEDDRKWFTNVQLVEGTTADAPRTDLQVVNAPFDSAHSMDVYEALTGDGGAADSLGVGTIQFVAFDDGMADVAVGDKDIVFRIEGESGSANVVGRYTDFDCIDLESLHSVDDSGIVEAPIFSAESDSVAIEEAVAP